MAVFYFPDPGIIEINQQHLDQLKQAARQAPLRRARFCLHRDENDKVHEMVIAYCRDSPPAPAPEQERILPCDRGPAAGGVLQ